MKTSSVTYQSGQTPVKPVSRALLTRIIWLMSLSSLYAVTSHAQHMTMSHGDHPAAGSHIYLKMMDTMMVQMDAVPDTISANLSFLLQMIPHHQAAIRMARFEIDHGSNTEMIQLAKSILTEQSVEVEQLSLLQSVAAAGQTNPDFNQSMQDGMDLMMERLDATTLPKGIDEAFAAVMLPHHQAAVDMAKTLLVVEGDSVLKSFAILLISNEQIEIEQMLTYLKR